MTESIVKEATILHIRDYLSQQEADSLMKLLNDKEKLRFQQIYFYDQKKKEVVKRRNHRKSYWLGNYAQATGTTDHWVEDRDTGKRILVPTDYVLPYEWPEPVLRLKERIEKEFGCEFNSCLVGLYDSPELKIGFHSDSSNAMGPDPQIASISFGRARKFQLKKQHKFLKETGPEKVDLVLEHGSLVIMKDGANARYLHAVPKDPGCNARNPRLNLTFRNYAYHQDERKIRARPWNEHEEVEEEKVSVSDSVSDRDTFVSPLTTRYSSPQMLRLWSDQMRYGTWRKLWYLLAKTEHELGLPVTEEQVSDLARHAHPSTTLIDWDRVAQYERESRHEVMAHIRALADIAPKAAPIIHLGATSQFVVCNTEILQIRESMGMLIRKLITIVQHLSQFAMKHRATPTLGFTHYQPAQPTTVGKRATLWCQDLGMALQELDYRLGTIKPRGAKGTTGTQASYLALFKQLGLSDEAACAKVRELDHRISTSLCVSESEPLEAFSITGQTYPRLLDGMIASSLATLAVACQKFATDIRLLANRKEIEEPFGKAQIGSSAMPYKRNPMLCERICGLSRYIITTANIPFTTAAEQWLERTLDDSSCRRMTIPQLFLAADGVLDIMTSVVQGLVVYEGTIRKNLMAELPFMASENLLMAAVARGHDRQKVHETIRQHAQAAASRVKQEGADNDLLERLQTESCFEGIDLKAELSPERFVGMAPEQVEAWEKGLQHDLLRISCRATNGCELLV